MKKKKLYVDGNGQLWDGKYIIVGDKKIFNPTEDMLAEAGYTEYEAPVTERSEQELLDEERFYKLKAIDDYDYSEAVNSFSLGGKSMWLTVEERQQIATQIAAHEAVGRDEMTKWFDGVEFSFSLPEWKQMLTALEVYAGDALNVTERHKAEVMALTTVADIEAYDHTAGYPEKLSF